MNSLKFTVLLGCAAMSARGVTIVSGYESYSWPSTTSRSAGTFSITLSDGFSFSGGGDYDGQAPPPSQCNSINGVPPCPMSLSLPLGANLNGDGGIFGNPFPFGTLNFVVGSIQPVAGVDNQTFSLPFTVTGDVSGPFDTRNPTPAPCPLPSSTSLYGCYETYSGVGTASVTARYQTAGTFNLFNSYWISSATFTFGDPNTATPEPSTIVFVAAPALLFLLSKRARNV